MNIHSLIFCLYIPLAGTACVSPISVDRRCMPLYVHTYRIRTFTPHTFELLTFRPCSHTRVIPFVDSMKCVGILPRHVCPLSSINEPFRFYLLLIPPSPYVACSSLLSLPLGTQWIVAMCVSIPPICFFANHDPAC